LPRLALALSAPKPTRIKYAAAAARITEHHVTAGSGPRLTQVSALRLKSQSARLSWNPRLIAQGSRLKAIAHCARLAVHNQEPRAN